MTTYFTDDFEDLTDWEFYDEWGTGTIDCSTIQKHSGTFSCRIHSDVNGSANARNYGVTPPGVDFHWSGYLFVDSTVTMDSSGIIICQLYSSSEHLVPIIAHVSFHDNKYYLRNIINTSNSYEDVCELSPNTMHKIDIYYKSAVLHFWVDDLYKGASAARVSCNTPNCMHIGKILEGIGQVYLDDIIIDNAAEPPIHLVFLEALRIVVKNLSGIPWKSFPIEFFDRLGLSQVLSISSSHVKRFNKGIPESFKMNLKYFAECIWLEFPITFPGLFLNESILFVDRYSSVHYAFYHAILNEGLVMAAEILKKYKSMMKRWFERPRQRVLSE